MRITIDQGHNYRCAYSDKVGGYMEFTCSNDKTKLQQNGYYRGDECLCKGFAPGNLTPCDIKSIDVEPYYCTLKTKNGELQVALLMNTLNKLNDIDYPTFYIKGSSDFEIFGIYSRLKRLPPDDDPNIIDLSKKVEEEKVRARNNNGKPKKEKQFKPVWQLKEMTCDIGGHKSATVLFSNFGFFVASEMPFNYEIVTESSLDIFDLDMPGTLRILGSNAPCYIGFLQSFKGQDQDCAFNNFNDTAFVDYSNFYNEHCKYINEFLNKTEIDLGNDSLNESVKWARFSAWMLSVKESCDDSYNYNSFDNHAYKIKTSTMYNGLWAGSPWFRDNWGRDTFISLTGTLLVSGCFNEARDVLLGFAQFQDLNSNSPTFGRIPNRYRGDDDVIYNTADGTLFFIRALYEYIAYSGDKDVILAHVKGGAIYDVVKRAVEADLKRCDEHGFLCCDEADTWMDARLKGSEALSPRGNRAIDIQALWYTALLITKDFANRLRDYGAASYYEDRANSLKLSITKYFYRSDYKIIADHLLPAGYGEWAPDLRVRPNQLFAITAPSVLNGDDIFNYSNTLNESTSKDQKPITGSIIPNNPYETIIKNVERELVTPYGLYTLSSQDPLFHAHHETCKMYHKDAAYHNGTIWPWISGIYISAAKFYYGQLPHAAWNILNNEAHLIMNGSGGDNCCAGSLSENIHALTNEDGRPILSGTFSQCWSLAEYLRNIYQDVLGFVPLYTNTSKRLAAKLEPSLPIGCNSASAKIPFGRGYIDLTIKRNNDEYDCTILWNKNNSDDGEYNKIIPLIENVDEVLILYGTKSYPLSTKDDYTGQLILKMHDEHHIKIKARNTSDKSVIPVSHPLPDFLGSEHLKDYLMNLIKNGRMHSMCCAGENTAALEWYFDSKEFNDKYNTNEELGVMYTPANTTFKLWAPTASQVSLILDSAVIPMKKGEKGVWLTSVSGDLHGAHYKYALMVHGVYNECIDPYATACLNSGKIGVICDRARTNPSGWGDTKPPVISTPCDAIIYELAIPDVTSSNTWNGSEEKRKTFLGVIESGTTYKDMPTGFDYIKSLGITHVQILPIFDFASIDDDGDRAQYNWGYDPRNYGCLKGFYSTNPSDPFTRITEFKRLVQEFANAGIGVIMDVVFNHVSGGLHTALGVTVPGYYFRIEGYSGAGEDTASEHYMFRKYMIDMLKFWLTEYKLCGFRFDLMGLHDTETMNAITSELHKIKPDVLIYGEGWDMYHAGKMTGASMCNARLMPCVSHFNDAVRCSIKGPCNDDKKPGFVHGGYYRDNIMAGVVGFTRHAQVDNNKVDLTANRGPWSDNSYTSLNYTEIHDNMTMMDKFQLVEPGRTESYYEQLAKMAISLVLLFQGIPAMQMGQEALRTKQIPVDLLDKRGTFCSDQAEGADHRTFYVRNSYNAPDAINNIDWERVYNKRGLIEYVKLVIKMRRTHKAFRITDGATISKVIKFIDNESAHLPNEVVAWCIDGAAVGDKWHSIFIIANPKNEPVGYTLPINSVFTSGAEGKWRVATDGVMFCEDDCIVKEVYGAQFVMVQPKTVSVFYTLQSE